MRKPSIVTELKVVEINLVFVFASLKTSKCCIDQTCFVANGFLAQGLQMLQYLSYLGVDFPYSPLAIVHI